MPFYHLALRAKKPPPKDYPPEPATLGEHLKRHRMDLGLQQKELAERLRIPICTIGNWEANRTTPHLRYLPQITDFLGYCTLDLPALTLGQRIRNCRRMQGLSQKRLAAKLGVDPSTIRSWEQDRHGPTGRRREAVETFLKGGTCDKPQDPLGP